MPLAASTRCPENIAPKAPLSGPSAEAHAHLIDLPIDYESGEREKRGGFVEHFRLDANGQVDASRNGAPQRKLAKHSSDKVATHRSDESRTAQRTPSFHQFYDYWSSPQYFSGMWGWR
jgi:hypothetical protein